MPYHFSVVISNFLSKITSLIIIELTFPGNSVGFVAAVINNKGGVGKTTVSCNLAHALGFKGKQVLVVDVDSQCNATALLIPKGTNPRHSLYELLEQDGRGRKLKDYCYPTRYERVFCLPNVPETATLEPRLILDAPLHQIFQERRGRGRIFTGALYHP